MNKMTSTAVKNNFLRLLASRGYAQAAPVPSVCSNDLVVKSNIVNNTVVASVETKSATTRVTVAFKAGSRYEPCTDLGLTHVLRSSVGISTHQANSFIMNRQLQQYGATVIATGDREHIYYTLEATKENLLSALDNFYLMLSNQEFRPWELTDSVNPRLKFDIHTVPPQVRAVDLMHKAAYRRGLGNSLFISPKRIGKISSETLQHYTCNYITRNRCAVTVIGDNEEPAQLALNSIQIQPGTSIKDEVTTYYGGEMRKEMGGELSHIALGLKGCAVGEKGAVALAVAARALGNGPSVKWGADHSPLVKAIGNIGPFAAAGFNVSYSDSGIFGLVLSVPKDEVPKALKAAVSFMKRPQVSSKQVEAAKKQLVLQILSENGTELAESLAAQALYTGKVKSPRDMVSEIQSVTDQDVLQALNAATKSKFSMGAVGNLSFVPYVDEL